MLSVATVSFWVGAALAAPPIPGEGTPGEKKAPAAQAAEMSSAAPESVATTAASAAQATPAAQAAPALPLESPDSESLDSLLARLDELLAEDAERGELDEPKDQRDELKDAQSAEATAELLLRSRDAQLPTSPTQVPSMHGYDLDWDLHWPSGSTVPTLPPIPDRWSEYGYRGIARQRAEDLTDRFNRRTDYSFECSAALRTSAGYPSFSGGSMWDAPARFP